MVSACPARPACPAQPAWRADGSPRTVVAALLTGPATRRTWAELAYLAGSVPLTAAGVAVLVPLLFASAGLVVIAVGLPLAAAVVLAARGLTRLHVRLATALLGQDLPPPPRLRTAGGLLGWVRPALSDSAGWRAVACLVLRMPLAIAGAYVVVALWVYYGLLNLVAPLWLLYHHGQAAAHPIVLRTPTNGELLSVRTAAGSWVLLAIGIVSILAAPWAVRALIAADLLVTRGLLGPDRLSGRIHELEQARARAVDDSAATVRPDRPDAGIAARDHRRGRSHHARRARAHPHASGTPGRRVSGRRAITHNRRRHAPARPRRHRRADATHAYR